MTDLSAQHDTRSQSGFDLSPPSAQQREALEASLSPEEAAVLLKHGTEAPFCGGLLGNKEAGVYVCRECGLPLFLSKTKFESGTGWPSFWQPIAKENIVERTDSSFGMIRIAVSCRRCDAHIGHVFDDGPKPTGLRYCVNSVAMRFAKAS